MNDLSFATMWDEDDEPGINCLALNSQGALPATVDVTLGLRSIISEAYLPPTIGRESEYREASYEFTVTKSPGSDASITSVSYTHLTLPTMIGV